MSVERSSLSTGVNARLTIIAALLAMLGPFSIDTYLPSFPAIELEFSINRAQLTQSLSVYLATFGVSTLFWGPLSDRIGRRLVMLFSLGLYVLASIACALAEDSMSFMLYRGLQGLAASGGFIAGRAMIRDAHDAVCAHKAMSQVMLLFALAPALAPIIGGWLQDLAGWRSVFWFLMGYGLFLMLLVRKIEETLPGDDRQSIHPGSVARVYLRTLSDRRFFTLSLSLSFSFAGMFLYVVGAPTVIYDFLGLDSHDFAWLFVPMVVGIMLGALFSGRLAAHWAARNIIALGFSLLALAVVWNLLQAVGFETTAFGVIAPLVLYAFGVALMMPALTILALDCFPKNRGSAASIQGFLQMMTNALVASVLVPALHARVENFALGQLGFVLLAAGLWYASGRKPA